MSIGRLPHTRGFEGSESQHRRRYNELADQVSNTVGSLETGQGDIGQLQTEINAINTTLSTSPFTSGQTVTATSAAANVEFSIPHTLGRIPSIAVICWQSLAASIYQGPTTGTAWTTTNIYLKSSVSSVQFEVYIS